MRLWWVNTLSKLPKRSLAESPMSRARERATAWVAILGNSQKSLKNGTWAITTHLRRERVSWTRAWTVACSRATSWWDEKEIRWTKNASFSQSLLAESLEMSRCVFRVCFVTVKNFVTEKKKKKSPQKLNTHTPPPHSTQKERALFETIQLNRIF